MIVLTLSAFGLTGKKKSLSKSWLFDLATSNHMTPSSKNLLNVKTYDDNLKIETANGNQIAIAATHDISMTPSMMNACCLLIYFLLDKW